MVDLNEYSSFVKSINGKAKGESRGKTLNASNIDGVGGIL